MFIRQREQTDRTFLKCLKNEKKRILISASKRNPQEIAAALKKQK